VSIRRTQFLQSEENEEVVNTKINSSSTKEIVILYVSKIRHRAPKNRNSGIARKKPKLASFLGCWEIALFSVGYDVNRFTPKEALVL
jgi:hypothetical protein